MEDPQKFPYLFHPDLRDKTRAYTYPRMFVFTKWWYAPEERIGWFGNVKREDGGRGLFCTLPQYEALPKSMLIDQGDIRIG